MKKLHLILILFLLSNMSCQRYQYEFDYFDIVKNEEVWESYQYVLEKSDFLKTFFEAGESFNTKEFYKYRFDLFKCEKEVDAIIVPVIENELSDCDGDVFGHHRFDLIAFKQTKEILFVFFSSELNVTKDLVIGPISMFLGQLHQQTNGQSVIKLKEKFVRNQRKQLNWVITKNFNMDLVLKDKVRSEEYLYNQNEIEIEKIIYRNPNKISGNKPMAFTFQNLIESRIKLNLVD